MAIVQSLSSQSLTCETNLSAKSNSRRCSSRFCAQKVIPSILRAFFEASIIPDDESILENSIDAISQLWDFSPDQESLSFKSESTESQTQATRDVVAKRPETKSFLIQGIYATASRREAKFLWPLPIYSGEKLLTQGRDFFLPWDILALTHKEVKTSGWRNIKRNIYIDVIRPNPNTPRPLCTCTEQDGCEEGCLNRAMFYECDELNCILARMGITCSNRNFEKQETSFDKLSQKRYMVYWTGDRGYGLRATQDIEPHSFILEYKGELIGQQECQERMKNMYKNTNNYYFLDFENGWILDAGRKGSEARFANHSCSPNAVIEKWFVRNEPRVGLFAGNQKILAGKEITYDYNFSWFEGSKGQEQVCRCGSPQCRGIIGRREKERLLEPPRKRLKTNNKSIETNLVVSSRTLGIRLSKRK